MSETVYYEPYKLPAGILALAVHCMFFALLYFGLNWNRQASLPGTMAVELWPSLPEEVIAPPPQPEAKEAVQPLPQEKTVGPDIVIPEKKKVLPKPAAPKPAAPKPDETRPDETRLVKNKSAQRAIEAAGIKAAAQKVAEQKQEAQRIADEQAASAQAARVKQDEEAAAIGKVVDEYKAKIMAKIRSHIVMPPDVEKDARAEFSVTLLPGGSVLPPRLTKSSGNAAYDNAVERAILKSDPLPVPPDVQLFGRFRELDLVFKPEPKK